MNRSPSLFLRIPPSPREPDDKMRTEYINCQKKEYHSQAEIYHQETCLQTNELPKLSTRRNGWIYTTFSNQASSTINARRMELHKLKILQLHI
jgi:hypothetical protein